MPVHRKILIIDQVAEFRKKVSQKLQKAGYQVFEAVHEDSALEILGDVKMDVVFWGQSASGSSPETFLKKLRRTFLGRNVPVLIQQASQSRGAFPKDPWIEFLPASFISLDDFLSRVDKFIVRHQKNKIPEKQKKVLIAGTENSVIEDMQQQLETNGFQVACATFGPDVITQAVQFVPDLLFIDVLIEGMACSEIIGLLRQMTILEQKPIILYSYYRVSDLEREEVRDRALNIETEQIRSKQAGANEYIGRYNESTFLDVVERSLD